MEQQRDTPSGTASDSVGEPAAPFVERHFWPILMGMIVLGLGASATVVYTQYSRVDQTLRSIPYFDQADQLATQATSALPYVGSADTSDGTTGPARKYGSFTRLESLVVNPEGADGRYLAVSIAFEAKSPSVTSELENKKIVVQDAVISHLSEQTVDELSDTAQREKLKKELRAETNKILTNGAVNRLYFTEFVLQ